MNFSFFLTRVCVRFAQNPSISTGNYGPHFPFRTKTNKKKTMADGRTDGRYWRHFRLFLLRLSLSVVVGVNFGQLVKLIGTTNWLLWFNITFLANLLV